MLIRCDPKVPKGIRIDNSLSVRTSAVASTAIGEVGGSLIVVIVLKGTLNKEI